MERTSVYASEDDLYIASRIAEREMVKPSVIIRKALREFLQRDSDYSLFLNECSQKKTVDAQVEQQAA